MLCVAAAGHTHPAGHRSQQGPDQWHSGGAPAGEINRPTLLLSRNNGSRFPKHVVPAGNAQCDERVWHVRYGKHS
jgi:hypothetical protein